MLTDVRAHWLIPVNPLLINDVHQHRRFMLVVRNELSQGWIAVITWMTDFLHPWWKNHCTASCRARQPAIPREKKQFISADKMSCVGAIFSHVYILCKVIYFYTSGDLKGLQICDKVNFCFYFPSPTSTILCPQITRCLESIYIMNLIFNHR